MRPHCPGRQRPRVGVDQLVGCIVETHVHVVKKVVGTRGLVSSLSVSLQKERRIDLCRRGIQIMQSVVGRVNVEVGCLTLFGGLVSFSLSWHCDHSTIAPLYFIWIFTNSNIHELLVSLYDLI